MEIYMGSKIQNLHLSIQSQALFITAKDSTYSM